MKKKEYLVLNTYDNTWFWSSELPSPVEAIKEYVRIYNITENFDCKVVEEKIAEGFNVKIRPPIVIEPIK